MTAANWTESILGDLDVQVINLDDGADRFAVASRQLDAHDIKFSRLSAVDGRQGRPEDFARYSPLRAYLWFGRKMTGAEIACFLSHLRAAEQIVASGKRFGLVLEDDFVLPDGFRPTLENLLRVLGKSDYKGWRLINLGHTVKIPQDARFCETLDSGNYNLCHCLDFPLRAHGLLWSRKGAKSFLKKVGCVTGGVDNWLRSEMAIYGGGYCLSPRLVGFEEDVSGSYIYPGVMALPGTLDSHGKKRGWWRVRSKWRGEWRSACGHLRGVLGIK